MLDSHPGVQITLNPRSSVFTPAPAPVRRDPRLDLLQPEREMREWALALVLVCRGAGALVVAPGAGGAGRAQVTSVSRVQTMEGETCDTS